MGYPAPQIQTHPAATWNSQQPPTFPTSIPTTSPQHSYSSQPRATPPPTAIQAPFSTSSGSAVQTTLSNVWPVAQNSPQPMTNFAPQMSRPTSMTPSIHSYSMAPVSSTTQPQSMVPTAYTSAPGGQLAQQRPFSMPYGHLTTTPSQMSGPQPNHLYYSAMNMQQRPLSNQGQIYNNGQSQPP